MTRTRRATESLVTSATDAAAEAIRSAGLAVKVEGPGKLAFSIDGTKQRIAVEQVAYCTGQRARELLRRSGTPLVVADRITAEARLVLSDAGWSWLDRRGHLHLRARGIRIDVDVATGAMSVPSVDAGPAIAGRSGLTVAYWLCSHPADSLSPTKNAPQLGLAPSTISTTVRRLGDAGLVEERGTGVFPELFWELAASWLLERT